MRLPIRVVVPLTIILITLLLSWWSLQVYGRAAMLRAEDRACRDLNLILTRLQAEVEHSFPVSQVSWLQEHLAELSADSDIMTALLIDENNTVIASAERRHIGQAVESALRDADPVSNALRRRLTTKALSDLQSVVEVAPNGRSLGGICPVRLFTPGPGLPPQNRGFIWIQRDLVPIRAEALWAIRQQTLSFGAGLATFALLLGIFFHFRVTRRVERLVDATRRISEGDLETHVRMKSNDELGELAGAINEMMDIRSEAEAALGEVAHGFSTISGEKFFEAFVLHLGEVLNADYVSVGLLRKEVVDTIRTIAYLVDAKVAENVEYDLAGTPCENVLKQQACVFFRRVQREFPEDQMLVKMGVEAYGGIPLVGSNGKTFGLLSVMYRRPIESTQRITTMLKIFATRAAAELERLQAEETLRFVQFAVDHNALPTYWIQADGSISYTNRAAGELLGYSSDELLKMKVSDIDPDFSLEAWPDHWKNMKEARSMVFEAHHQRKDGTAFPVEIRADFMQYENEEYIWAFARDTTEEKRAEADLRESEERMKLALRGADLGTWDWNLETDKVTFNERLAEMLGHELHEFESHLTSWAKRIHPDEMPWVTEVLNEHLEGKTESYETEHRLRHKSGHWIWVLDRGTVIERDADGKPLRMCGTHLDITERKKAQAEKEELDARATAIVDGAVDGIITIDEMGLIESLNPAVSGLFGYRRDELINQNINLLMPDHFQGEHDQHIENYRSTGVAKVIGTSRNVTGRHKDGKEIPLKLSVSEVVFGERRLFTGILHDLTHEVELEQLLVQAQKMESLGTLAGGIAHDFNNILQAILGYTTVAQQNKTGNEELLDQCLQEIQAGSRRATDLVDQILTFSRKSSVKYKPTSLQPLVEDALKFLRSSLPATIHIESKINDDCGQVRADASQIHQVATNLFTNAMHAMEEKGGILTVSLEQVSMESSVETLSGTLEPGDYIQLSVEDTGTGIDPNVFHRLLDPFFTTKEVGKGTGLGLSMVHGILKNMGAGLTIESELGVGTTVRVILHALKGSQEPERPREPTQTAANGKGRILVVDDEETITKLISLLLRSRGFTVDAFNDVDRALKALHANTTGYDMAILDYTMPGKNGLQLARDIHSLNPNMPVVLATGILEDSKLDRSESPNVVEIIRKPFDVDDLVALINRSFPIEST